MEVTYWMLDPHTHLETTGSLGFTCCPWPLSQNSKLAPFHDFLFSKTHDESHVLSPCLKTQLAGTDKSPEIPVLKPELPPCSPAVMEMARPGARWLVSMEPRNSLPSIQGLLLLFRKLLSKWDRTQPSLYSQIPLFLPEQSSRLNSSQCCLREDQGARVEGGREGQSPYRRAMGNHPRKHAGLHKPWAGRTWAQS